MPEKAERAGEMAASRASPEGKRDETILAESARLLGKQKEDEESPFKAAAPGNVAMHSAGARGAALPVEKTAGDQPVRPGEQDPGKHDGMAAIGAKSSSPMESAGRVESMDAAAQRDDAGPGENATGPDGVLVVRCDITPEAARNRTLDQLLLRNNIALEEDSPVAGPAQENDSPSQLREQSPAQAGAGPQLARGQANIPVPAAAEVTGLDVVYVEAAPEQLEPVLAAMNAMPGQFLTVSVEPPPQAQLAQSQRRANLVANQYDFSRYNRAKPFVGAEESATAAQDLKLSPAAPAGAAPQSHSPLQGTGPTGAIDLGKPGQQRLPAAPSQPSDKAQTIAPDGAGQATIAIGQELRGFAGRAVRVQLPQKLPAEEAARAATSRQKIGKQSPGSAGIEQPAAPPPLAPRPDTTVAEKAAKTPAPAQPAHGLLGKGQLGTQTTARSAEAIAPVAKPSAAPQTEPSAPARDQPEGPEAAPGKPDQLGKPNQLDEPEPSAKTDHLDEIGRAHKSDGLAEGGRSAHPEQSAQPEQQADRPKAKTTPSRPAQQQLQQNSGIYRVLFVIRVVPDAPATPAAQSAAEKSQAQE